MEPNPPSLLDQPTDEYTMRHAANLLLQNFGYQARKDGKIPELSQAHNDVINFAYQQLLRGANTLHEQEMKTVEAVLPKPPLSTPVGRERLAD